MYWLRRHCHVKDIAGAPYRTKPKYTEAPTVDIGGNYTVQYNHDLWMTTEYKHTRPTAGQALTRQLSK